MKIVEIRDIEYCLDGSVICDMILDCPVSRSLIDYLGTYGEMKYHAEFKRPFFRLQIPRLGTIKGVEGNRTLRVVFTTSSTESNKYLQDIINRFELCLVA